MQTSSCCAGLMGLALATSAYSIDIRKAEQRPVETEARSSKSIFDVERCIIGIDARNAPNVYRQPDRPDDATVVYSDAGVIFALVQLHATSGGTTIAVRSVTGFAGMKIERGAQACSA